MGEQDAGKQAAAAAVVALIRDGMTLGLGTGSTMDIVLDLLGARIAAEGLRVSGIPTSERTAERARRLGIALLGFADAAELDLAIDGADEVLPGSLAMIKGLGGALLREKIVAVASRRFVGVVDPSKVVGRLGERSPVPVEVVAFGHESTARHLARLGGAPALRLAGAAPLRTDSGNLIYDCPGFAPITEPEALAMRLTAIPGVVEHGLFLGIADQVLVGAPDGSITVLSRG
jgi:ribose 5-phosphate isomerase A